MTYMNRLEPPEPEFSDEQWDAAYERLITDLVDDGWSREDAEAHIGHDDMAIYEQCEADVRDREATWADEERARRKEGW